MDDATSPPGVSEVGIRELRDHLSRYVAAVREGSEVVITDHGRAVARLVPVAAARPIDRLIAEGVVTPAERGDGGELPEPLDVGATVSDLVAEQRR